MYFTNTELSEQLNVSALGNEAVADSLKARGFQITKLENGTIFALLLGDMPSKESSVFVTAFENTEAVAQLLAMASYLTEERDYKSRIHHPDIELVFLSDWTAASAPSFQLIYSLNAYLLEEAKPVGTLLFASDPIVKERYGIVVEGLKNHYTECLSEPSVMNRLFSEKDIRTVSVSYGTDLNEAVKNAEILMYLSVAYQE